MREAWTGKSAKDSNFIIGHLAVSSSKSQTTPSFAISVFAFRVDYYVGNNQKNVGGISLFKNLKITLRTAANTAWMFDVMKARTRSHMLVKAKISLADCLRVVSTVSSAKALEHISHTKSFRS